MSYEIVHTFGFTVYFVFLLFFLWVSRFAKTMPGVGWWAMSISFALCGRIVLDQLTAQIPISGASYALGASIGISLYPIHGTKLAELIDRADSAMYQVKRNGKSGYVIYDAR